MDRIRTAHELIKTLGRDCPALLLNVVPQLEEELKVDRLAMRTLATQALGEMFGDSKTGLELAKKYQTAWQAWLQRRNDKAAPVRLAFVEATVGLITNHGEMRTEIEGACLNRIVIAVFDTLYIEALKNKLLDPDDKVRAASCRVYGQLDYETALHHVSNEQLQEVATRCLDKKVHIPHFVFLFPHPNHPIGGLVVLARCTCGSSEMSRATLSACIYRNVRNSLRWVTSGSNGPFLSVNPAILSLPRSLPGFQIIYSEWYRETSGMFVFRDASPMSSMANTPFHQIRGRRHTL